MQIKPLGDRILIEKVEAEEKTAGGIVLPTSEEIQNDEKKKDLLHVGDKVIFSKFSGTEVKNEGKIYLIVKWPDILAVVK